MSDTPSTAAANAAELWLADPARMAPWIASLREGVVVHDGRGAVVASNASAQRLLGLMSDEMSGLTPLDPRWRAVRADGSPLPGDEHPAMAALRTRAESRGVSMGVPHADGELTWIEVDALPLLDAAGSSAVAVIATLRDVTALARATEQLLELQRLERLGRLTAGIAHDFNNALTAILGNADLLEASLGRESPLRKHTQRILASCADAAELARKLLTYAGPIAARTARLELSDLVADALRFLRVALPRDGCVETQLSETPLHVVADPARLTEAIANLVLDAAEAWESVCVATGAMHANRAYLESTQGTRDLPEGRYAWIEVQADGRCTDTAARAPDLQRTNAFTGAELGLAVVLGIARAHRGALRVTRGGDGGTTVRVLLPMAD